MKKSVTVIMILLAAGISSAVAAPGKEYKVTAPGGKLSAEIRVGERIEYRVIHDGDPILDWSGIALSLDDGRELGRAARVAGKSERSVDEELTPVIYKKGRVRDNYNELTVRFREGFTVTWRAYDDGVAYRFATSFGEPFRVAGEAAAFNFPGDNNAYTAYVNPRKGSGDGFFNSFENTYTYSPLSGWEHGKMALLPVLVEAGGGRKVCITEADLMDYPGMYLTPGEEGNSLKGIFAPFPREIVQGGHNMLQGVVTSVEPYLAECAGESVFPWRVVILSERDAELLASDVVYKLATPDDGSDYSWVKPGKVAWDWWNAWNLYGVDFKAGINNETYRYYIDFAADNGIEYVILDEGWAVHGEADLMKVIPEIDLPHLVSYARERGVGLILWAGYLAFDRDMEEVCRHYSQMGIKGFKIDFMDRDDQPMVRFHTRAAETAARYKMMVDFHGSYKPTGLHRTWPNVINYEGVFGLENMKWSDPDVDMVTYDVTMPFIRMVAGPVDYTQGAMRNAARGNYRPVNSEAMSQGTRCRQLAQYVVFDSPLNMLCDSPSNYMAERECLDFIAAVPTVWDDTVPVNGEVGQYVTVARRRGEVWYVGGMTGWDAREFCIDLSFLGEGNYEAELFRDGVNADRAARDYVKEIVAVPDSRELSVAMAPGGGFAMKIVRKP